MELARGAKVPPRAARLGHAARPMSCPACGYYNPPGQERCFHCALLLPVSAGDARCALHPEVKASGACSRCGTFGCGPCLEQRGEAWLCPSCRERSTKLPWDEREQLGLWRAWWRTSTTLISSPAATLRTVEPDAPLGSSVLFALLSTLAGFMPTVAGYALVAVPLVMLRGDEPELRGLGGGLVVAGVAAFYVVFLLFMQLASMLFFAALDQLGLLLLGAQPKGFNVSVRASALSMAPYLLGLVPICGLYVFPLWALVLRIVGLSALHRTSGGKAAVAVLLPVVLLCGLVLIIYASVFALAAGRMR